MTFVAHDAFISYATEDKVTADAVCATLEQKGIRCWIAPRDVIAGQVWAEAITDAMSDSRLMILVFSSHANESHQISREVNLAANREIPIVPFRIEDVQPSKSLEFFISSAHWLDALTPGLEKDLLKLATTVRRLVPEKDDKENASPEETQKSAREAKPEKRSRAAHTSFCRKCGTNLSTGAKFCRKCGTSVST